MWMWCWCDDNNDDGLVVLIVWLSNIDPDGIFNFIKKINIGSFGFMREKLFFINSGSKTRRAVNHLLVCFIKSIRGQQYFSKTAGDSSYWLVSKTYSKHALSNTFVMIRFKSEDF